MKKILSNNSIKNKTLRQRSDLSPLLKTYCHRYNEESNVKFKKWLKSLDAKDINEIRAYYGKDSIKIKTDFLIKFITPKNIINTVYIKAISIEKAIDDFRKKYPFYLIHIVLDCGVSERKISQ